MTLKLPPKQAGLISILDVCLLFGQTVLKPTLVLTVIARNVTKESKFLNVNTRSVDMTAGFSR